MNPDHKASLGRRETRLLVAYVQKDTGDKMEIGCGWCGVVWCGMVWYGVVWCGMVWYGVVWWSA